MTDNPNALEAYTGIENLVEDSSETPAPKEKEQPKAAPETKDAKQADDADKDTEADDLGEDPEADKASDADKGADADDKNDKEDDAQLITRAEAKKMAIKRISELTRDKKRLLREIAQLRGGASQGPADKSPLTDANSDAKSDASSKEKPSPDNFKYGEVDPDYLSALADWAVEQKLAELSKKDAEKRQREAAERDAQEVAEKSPAIFDAGREKYDDFDEVVVEGARNNEWPLSNVLGKLILGSDHAADILYHLGSNVVEAHQVFGLPDTAQNAYFKRLEKRFSSEAKSKKAGADNDANPEPKAPSLPPPPAKQARGAGGKFEFDPFDADFNSFLAQWNKKSRR